MTNTTFASIDIGSRNLTMKIYEISPKEGYRRLDYVNVNMSIGAESYRTGMIGMESLDEICNVIMGFKMKMKEYGVKEYRAYATSALREADNKAFILNQIYVRTGIKASILSNSEQRFLMIKALAYNKHDYDKTTVKNTAIVDIGGGSVQISLVDKGNLIATQNLKIGSIRVRNLLSDFEFRTVQINKVLEEYIGNEIDTFKNLYLKEKEIKNVIVIGDEINNLVKIVPELKIKDSLNQEQITYIYDKLKQNKDTDLAYDYGISEENASLLMPAIIMISQFFAQSKAELIYTANIDLCDGIVVDYMVRKKKYDINHDFNADTLAAARNLSKHYKCNKVHIQKVTQYALKIFDHPDIKKIHGLGQKERLQLQIAAILHDCGKYVNMSDSAQNSYYIIMSTEIVGLSHMERQEVANIVRYNTRYLPGYDKMEDNISRDSYMRIAKLAAILRVANALDRSHMQKISNISLEVKDKKLIIKADTKEDITLEKGLFESKANFFQNIYGILPVLKQEQK